MLRHALIDQVLDVFLEDLVRKVPFAAVLQVTNLPQMIEEFLTGGTDKVVPS